MGKKSHNNAKKNLVKLLYSVQKLLSLNLVLFFVLISNYCVNVRLYVDSTSYSYRDKAKKPKIKAKWKVVQNSLNMPQFQICILVLHVLMTDRSVTVV